MRFMRLTPHQTRGRILLAALLVATAATTSGQVRDQSGSQRPHGVEEALIPGDAIRLRFWREPGFSGDYPVDEAGGVVLPLLGVLNVTGVPASELKRQLLEGYELELRNQDVQITMLRRVRVLGRVAEPGLYHVDATMTLGDAIALAGGGSPGSRLNDIRILRNGTEVRSNLEVSARVAEQVRSGDQIMVPQRSWLARNTGFLLGALISASAILISAAVYSR